MYWWLLICVAPCIAEEWRQVSTDQGEVRGRMDPEGGLFVFNNIPYATVPKGRDRYKAPLPPPKWKKPFNATNIHIACMASDKLNYIPGKEEREECLVVNVYAPDVEDKNLPVMVYVYGGGFENGFGDQFQLKHLVRSNKIIAVTFNYRIGVTGHLCLGTKNIPGNAAMKDQVALLRWVKKNISNFGGDNSNIALAGYSSGSISADLLMLSKSTNGLFTKVILESNAALGGLGLQKDPLQNAKVYAKLLGFDNVENFTALEEFYMSESRDRLAKGTLYEQKTWSPLIAPCIERQDIDDDIFLDDSPFNIITQGLYKKVPILIGFSNMEGIVQTNKFEEWKDAMNNNFVDFVPADLKFESDAQKEEYASKIRKFYFKDKLVDKDTILNYVDFYTDIVFIQPILRSVKLHVEAGHKEIYLYEYTFVDEREAFVPYTKVRGATHCSQTAAVLDGDLLNYPDNENNYSDEYKAMKVIMRALWANFVKYGFPVPGNFSMPIWPPAGVDYWPYMTLNMPLRLHHSVPYPMRTRFWDEIYDKFYDAPITPRHQDT